MEPSRQCSLSLFILLLTVNADAAGMRTASMDEEIKGFEEQKARENKASVQGSLPVLTELGTQ